MPNAFFFPGRIHHKGFRINNCIYSFGGITEKGIILNDVLKNILGSRMLDWILSYIDNCINIVYNNICIYMWYMCFNIL